MKEIRIICKAVLLGACAALAAGAVAATKSGELPPKPSVADIVKASRPGDWRALDPDNTLYMDTAAGRVVIELAPTFAPRHVQNIKALVREHYFDGLAIVRVQDNWVVQWGDPNEDKPDARPVGKAQKTLKAEFTVPLKNDTHFTRLPDSDGYAPQAGHSNGFPVGRDPKTGETWLAHCYGMVGVGRDNDADSGGGTSLYAVIGPARHLDRNITVVGRVIAGMPQLAALPRGPAPMGFYDKPEMNVAIGTVKVAADLPPEQRSKFDVMRTDSAAYRAVLDAQRNRGGPWTKVAAGHIDLCAAPIPIREQP
ncbi:peptidylprolyl isomerase [Massilia forsythiae]|uniref:peptidylprolyl isomerase n=1 Tax=Massilia forsythiae TaxID=2728020 RepID=A0A7Z2ZSL9_9BURK|nr:peptidylprolyl isomerase [Massilia forsythiae]QJE00641.1 peptidylprolyl isomerase [Massilia forsythiae]